MLRRSVRTMSDVLEHWRRGPQMRCDSETGMCGNPCTVDAGAQRGPGRKYLRLRSTLDLMTRSGGPSAVYSQIPQDRCPPHLKTLSAVRPYGIAPLPHGRSLCISSDAFSSSPFEWRRWPPFLREAPTNSMHHLAEDVPSMKKKW